MRALVPSFNGSGVLRSILTFLIACSLVVPGIAWGAHLVGHAPLHAAEDAHTHDIGADALEAHDEDPAGALDEAPDRPAKSLVHDHSGAHTHASIIVNPDEALALAGQPSAQLLFARHSDSGALPRLDSLLRPPRTA